MLTRLASRVRRFALPAPPPAQHGRLGRLHSLFPLFVALFAIFPHPDLSHAEDLSVAAPSVDSQLLPPLEISALLLVPFLDKGNDPALWNMTRRGLDNELSISTSVGARLLNFADERLAMAERGPLARLAFLLTLGQVDARFQYTHSVFGHEEAHCIAGFAVYRVDCRFTTRDEANEELDWPEVYWNLWTTFLPKADYGGVARDDSYEVDADVFDFFSPRGFGEGLNYQMSYSETLARDLYASDQHVFWSQAFLINRGFLGGYALYDAYGDFNGDTYLYIESMRERFGDDALSIEALAALGTLSAFSSSASLGLLAGLWDYIAEGDKQVRALGLDLGEATLFWDLPVYINPSAITVAPRLYLRTPLAALSDPVLLGIGFETPVSGDPGSEAFFTARGRLGAFEMQSTLSIDADGDRFLSLEGRYNFDRSFIGASLDLPSGVTFESSRRAPLSLMVVNLSLGYAF